MSSVDPQPAPDRRQPARWIVPLAGVIMLAMAGYGIVEFGGGPRALWRVVDVAEPGGLAGAPADGFVLEYGRVTTGPGTTLELQLGDQLRLRILPGSDLDLPAPPRRWRPDSLVVALRQGEVEGIAGDLDVPLRVTTRNARVLIHAGAFAVFQDADASGAALWDGTAEITDSDRGATHTLLPRHRTHITDDGTTPEPQRLDDALARRLQGLHDAGLLPDPIDQR